MRKFCDCFENFIHPWLAFAEPPKLWRRGNFKPSLWSTSSFKNNISMVLRWPLFEVAQYALEILRSILDTGGRYEHRCYSVQGTTYNVNLSSTCLLHHAWYCLLCPKSLDQSYLPTMSHTRLRRMKSYEYLPTRSTTSHTYLRDQLHLIISTHSFIIMNTILEKRLMRGKCYLTTWSSTNKSTETFHFGESLSKQGGNATTMVSCSNTGQRFYEQLDSVSISSNEFWLCAELQTSFYSSEFHVIEQWF